MQIEFINLTGVGLVTSADGDLSDLYPHVFPLWTSVSILLHFLPDTLVLCLSSVGRIRTPH